MLPDISYIQDEAIFYRLDRDKGVIVDRLPGKIPVEASLPPSPPPPGIVRSYFKNTWYIYAGILELFDAELTPAARFTCNPNRAAWTESEDLPDYGDVGVAGGKALALQYMGELKQLLDRHNIKMSVAVYPWPYQLVNSAPDHLGVSMWREFCRKAHCANFIDANVPFFDEVKNFGLIQTLNKYYINKDVHMNKEGNKLIFKAIEAGFSY